MYKTEKSFDVIKAAVPDFRKCSVAINQEFNFEYSGNEQTFDVPCDGTYKIELWGAQGLYGIFGTQKSGGLGGYVSGDINLKEKEALYVYVGNTSDQYNIASYNGGGLGNTVSYALAGYMVLKSGSGGGATDVRLTNGAWNNFESLKSRIMVAGGGSGGVANGTNNPGGRSKLTNIASFGTGGNGVYYAGSGGYDVSSGGGGGYYGGTAATGYYQVSGVWANPGYGGTSFISGHVGCNAISADSTASNIILTNQPNHYSKYIFTNTEMIDGAGYSWSDEQGEYTGMPTHDGTESTMDGNTGNGYARITYLGK